MMDENTGPEASGTTEEPQGSTPAGTAKPRRRRAASRPAGPPVAPPEPVEAATVPAQPEPAEAVAVEALAVEALAVEDLTVESVDAVAVDVAPEPQGQVAIPLFEVADSIPIEDEAADAIAEEFIADVADAIDEAAASAGVVIEEAAPKRPRRRRTAVAFSAPIVEPEPVKEPVAQPAVPAMAIFQAPEAPKAQPRMRVVNLARELGLESKALMVALEELGHPVKSPSTTIDQTIVERLRTYLEEVDDLRGSDDIEGEDPADADAGTEEGLTDIAEGDMGEDEGGDGLPRKRRRRRGGRRRRRPNQTDVDQADIDQTDLDADDDDESDSDESDAEDAEGEGSDDTDGASEDGGDESGVASSRRRRRRRRVDALADDFEDISADDTVNTVVRVRQNRRTSNEVTSVKGSTRLEAKKQRRREGRDAGRRRAPILTEAEFLARRESVDRVMVVRQLGDRTQIGVLEDGVLVEHYVSRTSNNSMVGNVYLGRVQNVLPSMEAAFVDIGRGRNAVLYAGEVNWDAVGLEGQPKRIEFALKAGDSVLVQVTKDPVGHKGARLTSQISMPGRFLVYVPQGSMTGISRKLPDTERNRLKSVLRSVVPEDAGVIVRTAAEGASEEELTSDVRRLAAQWEDIQKKASSGSAPQMLYAEPDLAIKVVRDIFNEDFNSLLVQGSDAWDTLRDYISWVAPDLAERMQKWVEPTDVFAAHRIDEQLAKALDRKVWLPSGGSLVIDRTEAMTVVDVNTGKFVGQGGNLEETVTKNNLEAAEEIVRQLRLRDIGGIIVVDFIDMVLESNRDLVLRRLVECLGRDRTKHQVAEVTSLGLVQMTRKRIGQGLLEVFSTSCEACNGRGLIVQSTPAEPTHEEESDDRRPRRGSRRGDSTRNGSGSNGSGSNDSGRNDSGRNDSGRDSARAEAARRQGKVPPPPHLEHHHEEHHHEEHHHDEHIHEEHHHDADHPAEVVLPEELLAEEVLVEEVLVEEVLAEEVPAQETPGEKDGSIEDSDVESGSEQVADVTPDTAEAPEQVQEAGSEAAEEASGPEAV